MTSADRGPQRLYLFQVATGTVPVGDTMVPMSAGCYLVQTGDGKNILIDSGVPSDFPPPGGPPIDHGRSVLEQLAGLDIGPEEIDAVICTHFDIDHVGHHAAFPNAEFVVQRRQYDTAVGGHERFGFSRPYWDLPASRFRLVDGDIDLLPGLRLLETSGHAPGHQSVLVNLPESGAVLLAIDAVSMSSLFTPERAASPLDDNEGELRASTRKLLDLVEREGIALTIFHHDGGQWETLRMAPEWYG